MQEAWATFSKPDGTLMGMTAGGHTFVISTVEDRLSARIEKLEQANERYRRALLQLAGMTHGEVTRRIIREALGEDEEDDTGNPPR